MLAQASRRLLSVPALQAHVVVLLACRLPSTCSLKNFRQATLLCATQPELRVGRGKRVPKLALNFINTVW